MSYMRQMLGRPVTSRQRREFGLVGIDCHEHGGSVKRARNTGQELCDTRSDPVFPQSIIAQKCRLTLPPSCGVDNADPADLLAPRGSAFGACNPKHGEWAVARSRADALPDAGLSGGHFSDLQVFTCGNDVPRDYQWTFVGICTNTQDLMDQNRDDAGAVDIAGTVSGINTGPEAIYAGQTVWISNPVLTTGPDGKTKVPRWRWPGAPADKAYFGTRPLKWNCVNDAVVDIKTYLADQYKLRPTQEFVNEATLADDMNIRCGVRDEMPIFVYAVVSAHLLRVAALIRVMFDGKTKDRDDGERSFRELMVALNALLAYLQKTEAAHQRYVRAFDAAVGGPEPLYNESAVMRIPPLPDLSSGEDVADMVSTVLVRYVDLIQKADGVKDVAVGRMHDFLRGRIMGVALSNSQPGAQLDLLLGQNRG